MIVKRTLDIISEYVSMYLFVLEDTMFSLSPYKNQQWIARISWG